MAEEDAFDFMRAWAAGNELRALDVFRQFDKDRSGTIDARELKAALLAIGAQFAPFRH